MVFTSSKEVQPHERNGKYITEEYIHLTLYYIIRELITVQTMYQEQYGEMVILFDDWKKDYWRKDVYPGYKAHRKSAKDKTKIEYSEVYVYINKLAEQLENNLPWRCVTVNSAEADDTILILSREFSKHEKILIYSPDKDFIQAQRGTTNVDQYSPLTKKWLKSDTKSGSMDEWIMEHVVLGDESDGVPKVVHHCEFSDEFLEHLDTHCVPHTCKEVYNFIYGDELTNDEKIQIMQGYTFQKKNKAGEDIGLHIYKDVRFGPTTLKKAIEKHGTLDDFLDSHPLYRLHYERNWKLVMEEGIPDYIIDETFKNLNEAKTCYNKEKFIEYLKQHNLFGIEELLPRVFQGDEISVENMGW